MLSRHDGGSEWWRTRVSLAPQVTWGRRTEITLVNEVESLACRLSGLVKSLFHQSSHSVSRLERRAEYSPPACLEGGDEPWVRPPNSGENNTHLDTPGEPWVSTCGEDNIHLDTPGEPWVPRSGDDNIHLDTLGEPWFPRSGEKNTRLDTPGEPWFPRCGEDNTRLDTYRWAVGPQVWWRQPPSGHPWWVSPIWCFLVYRTSCSCQFSHFLLTRKLEAGVPVQFIIHYFFILLQLSYLLFLYLFC